MNWIPIIKWGAIALGILGLGGWAYGVVRDHFSDIEAKEQQILRLEVDLSRTRSERDSLILTMALEDAHDAEIGRLKEIHAQAVEEINSTHRDDIAVLADRERFESAVDSKPGLVERLANKATQERFDELEAVYSR